MRTVINFSVSGDSLDDCKENALGIYRDLVKDPDAELPHSATLEVRPTTVGSETAWEADVTISESAGGGSR